MWKLTNSKVNRIKKHFLNNGEEGSFTKFFENFDSQIQDEIIGYNLIDTNEIPIIASYAKDRYLALLSDNKLYWVNGNNKNSLLLSEIDDANIDIYKHKMLPSKINHLHISTISGEIFSIELEEGRPLCGFMNVILLIARLNKSQD